MNTELRSNNTLPHQNEHRIKGVMTDQVFSDSLFQLSVDETSHYKERERDVRKNLATDD